MKTSVSIYDPDIIEQLVKHIVTIAHPIRVILFGSIASGKNTSHSDLDFLVIVKDGTHRRQTAQKIYKSLVHFSVPVDVVVATEADIDRYQDNFSLVYYSALREGKEIYAIPCN